MIRAHKLFWMLWLFGSVAVQAQERASYTLDDCIQEALRNNPLFAISQDTMEMAKQDVAAANGKYYPEVGFQGGLRRFETHIFLPEQLSGPRIPPVVGPINDWQVDLRANYMLYDSGSRSSDAGAAEAQLAAVQQDMRRTQNDVAYQVESLFYQVLQAQDAVELSRQQIERAKDHLRIAQARKDAGDVPQADVTRARTRVASAEVQLAATESALRIAKGSLNQAMGFNPATPLTFVKPAAPPRDPSGVLIDEALHQATQARPEVLAAQHRAEAKRRQIGAVRSEILPKLRAEAGYGWRDDDFDPPDKDWWVGVTLNIPLFDGGVRSARIAKSKIEQSREEQQVRQLELSVQQEVWTSYSRWLEAFQRLKSSGAMKDEAAESLDLIKARYEEGAGTINDLLDAELSLDSAESELSQSEYAVHIAEAGYMRAISGRN